MIADIYSLSVKLAIQESEQEGDPGRMIYHTLLLPLNLRKDGMRLYPCLVDFQSCILYIRAHHFAP